MTEEQVEEVKTGISSAIRGCRASGNSLQVNAPIVGKLNQHVVGRKNIYNYIIGTHLHYSTPIITNGVTTSGGAPRRRPVPLNKAPHKTVAVKLGVTGPPTPLQRLVRLYNDVDCEWNIVCARICPAVGNNWISGRIVRRLSLKSHPIRSFKEADCDGKHFTSSGQVVDLVCSQESSKKDCRHRFYVVEHVPFDVLFGRELS